MGKVLQFTPRPRSPRPSLPLGGQSAQIVPILKEMRTALIEGKEEAAENLARETLMDWCEWPGMTYPAPKD